MPPVVAPPTSTTGTRGLGLAMYCRRVPTAYPTRVSVSAVMPFGWFSRKSSAMPPTKPASEPDDGPSRKARTMVAR
jgi:hypothetical protein